MPNIALVLADSNISAADLSVLLTKLAEATKFAPKNAGAVCAARCAATVTIFLSTTMGDVGWVHVASVA